MVATRRNPGEGGLHWEESRQRWFATVYVGYAPNGKRRKVKVSARTKTEAKAKLRQRVRDQEEAATLRVRLDEARMEKLIAEHNPFTTTP